jgi:hypothetical protein
VSGPAADAFVLTVLGLCGIVAAWGSVRFGVGLGALIALVALLALNEHAVSEWPAFDPDAHLVSLPGWLKVLAYAGLVLAATIVGHRRRTRADAVAYAYVVHRRRARTTHPEP